MQIEAIYDHGRITLPEHLRLRHQRFTVRLDIPDHEVSAAGESKEPPRHTKTDSRQTAGAPSSVRSRIDGILGPYKGQISTATVNTKALWHEHLEEKHFERG